MNPADDFSRSYAEARGKFRAASRRRGLAAESVRLPGRAGVEGETLTIDASLLGPPGAPSLLVLTSATHGIEGYCGSGIQTALLRDDEFVAAALGAGVAVLFVHALNPYGFSHGRRVNEDNVDLNRNFRDFGSPPPENPAYAELHPLLIPDAWPPPGENDAAIAAYLAAHGERAFQAALSGGQYAFPRGMFYGGSEPTWSNRSLRAVLASHAPGTKRVGWIDFHTGLGAPGVGERIYNGRRDALALDRARGW